MKKILGLLMVCACLLDGLVYAGYDPVPQSAEDTAHVDAEKLVRVACRRIDTAAASGGTTGDWITEDCDSNGEKRNSELPAPAALADATANPTVSGIASYMMCFNGTTWDRCLASANIAHDAAATSAVPLLTGCYANAAAPADVSADLDSTREWCLRNGARAIQPTFAGVLGVAGTGTRNSGVQRVTIATDDVVPASQSGTWTVQPGNTANTTPWLASQVPATAGGLSISRTLSAANTTGISVKGSAGQVYGWYISNVNAAARFVKLYNKATAATCGTDTPVMTVVVPGATTGGGTNVDFSSGIAFATGISYCITAAVADNDTTAPAANEIIVNLLYK